MSRSRFRPGIAAAVLLVSAAVMVHLGCGLETYPALWPPVIDTSAGDFGFRSPENLTDPNHLAYFRGYEVYYKLYAEETQVQSDIARSSDLEPNGFRRLTREGDSALSTERPLIPVPLLERDQEHQVYLTFLIPGEQPAAVVSWDPSNPVLLRRGVQYPEDVFSDEYQLFREFDQDDVGLPADKGGPDISVTVWNKISLGQPVYLALYAVSYGLDPNSPVPLVTEPEFLLYRAWTLETP